jgi:monofunctional biosynthetic peptidoglycan transglycosylase
MSTRSRHSAVASRQAIKTKRWTIKRILLIIILLVVAYLGIEYLMLPSCTDLITTNPPTTALIEVRMATARSQGKQPQRQQTWLPLSRISPNLARAVLAGEDSLFFKHEGFDTEQIKKAMEENWKKGDFVRGASTITQQLAKNLYLSESKNPLRKLKEAIITRRLEAKLTKQRILEIYLNVIEWGDGIYGAEAAARYHLKKSATQLSTSEAAFLSAMIPNPRTVYNPKKNPKRVARRQKNILRHMSAIALPAKSP